MVSQKTVNTLLASAVALTVAGGAGTAAADMIGGDNTTSSNIVKIGKNGCEGKGSCESKMKKDAEAAPKKEKCYGIVKAGSNDFANAAKTHSCSAQAATDGEAGEWLYLPAGTCAKLVGGSTTPPVSN